MLVSLVARDCGLLRSRQRAAGQESRTLADLTGRQVEVNYRARLPWLWATQVPAWGVGVDRD